MATELARPGTEVIQEFQSTSPTIVTPTLVPCSVAPFFEVIEVTNSDGTVNSDAKLTDLYVQFEVTVSQSSFPSPRGNIDEVDIQEDSIRTFFNFGGALNELSQTQAFLANINTSTQPYVMGTGQPAGFDIDGRTLIFQKDSHTALPPTAGTLPTSADVTITFAATTPGGTLTISEVIAQINAVVPGVAFDGQEITGVGGDAGKLALQSTRYGARASVVVRETGTANAVADGLGFSAAEPELAVGAGFYAIDDGDSDLLSPRIEFYQGTTQKLLSAGDTPAASAVDFTSYSILAGDTVVAEGVDIGEVVSVTTSRLTMEVEQNIMTANVPFAPKYFWVRANGLSYPAPSASTAAAQTGTQQTSAASVAYIVGASTGTYPIGASESFDCDVTIDGVAQTTETISSGAGWADLAAAIAGINAAATNFEAYPANDVGDEHSTGTYLGLRTKADNTGSGAGITYSAETAGMNLGMTLASTDVGENIRYLPGTPAFAVGALAFSATVNAETITYTPEFKGTAKAAETITWAAAHGTLSAAIADWNSQALWTEAYSALSTGVESATGTYFAIRTRGENVGLTAEIDITATDSVPNLAIGTYNGTDTDLDGTNFKWSLDNNPTEYDVTFVADEDDGGTSLQHVLDKINELTTNIAEATSDSPPYLKLESNKVGEASEIEVTDGSANSILGFTDDTSVTGGGRPAPDMAIDVSGNIVLQSQILRDGLTGDPFAGGFADTYIAYKALRLDLSPDADEPSLLTVDDTSTVGEVADPISTDNPGALMLYLQLLNAPGVTVASIGVPEVSADAPDGTPAGYATCAEYLESKEVYAICTASQNPVVHQTFQTHVNFMSEPEQKGERIYFFNPEIPDRASPDLLASGTDANSTPTSNELTVDVNVAPALIAAGIDPNLDINPTTGAIENEVYIDLGTDDKYYLVQKVTGGTTITLRTTFATGDGNSDSFFSETTLPTGIISDDWSLYIRGDELLVSGTTKPDYQAIAETIQGVAQTYGDRRMYYVHPDQCGINVTGLEQLVEGYYATACISGMVGQQPPQQGFTNFPITGLTRVVGSNDKFTNRQMNVMAAGGTYILVQDEDGAPVICRHQLSTDLTSIETRELSITKVVDYCAKFYRKGLRTFIGRSNITQPFLDNLSTVVEGLGSFLRENNVVIGADVNNIIQDADNPDTVLIDITLDVPYPCNYVRLVLVV